MAGRNKTYRVSVDERQRQELRQVVASRKSAQSLVQRAQIVLLCAEQPTWRDQRVATELNCSAGQVRKWRKPPRLYAACPSRRTSRTLELHGGGVGEFGRCDADRQEYRLALAASRAAQAMALSPVAACA